MGSGEVLRAEGLGGSPHCLQTEVSVHIVRSEDPPLNIPQGLAHLLGASPASLSGR